MRKHFDDGLYHFSRCISLQTTSKVFYDFHDESEQELISFSTNYPLKMKEKVKYNSKCFEVMDE